MAKILLGKSVDVVALKGIEITDFKNQARVIKEINQAMSCYRNEPASCYVCGSSSKTKVVEVHGLEYVQCDVCTHVYQHHIIPDEKLIEFFIEDESLNVHVAEGQYEYRRKELNRSKIQQLLSLFQEQGTVFDQKKWLDCGCGSGDLMWVARDEGWSTVGFDIGRPGVEIAKQNSLDAHLMTIDDFYTKHYDASAPFDVVSAIGYLDLVEPVSTLKKIKKMMKKGSYILLDQPKFTSITIDLIRRMPEKAIRYLNAAQRSNFTPESLRRLLTDAGFEVKLEWYYGLDMYQLLSTICLTEPRLADSEIVKLIAKEHDKFQAIVDESGLSDTMVFAAELVG
jgi:2-polyprenyl-3-methyl-5-hydroxy-6-metoxy-1,4-benzoquinol methylase